MSDTAWKTGSIRLNIGGRPATLEVSVPAEPVKPHRMLPVFQKMANGLVSLSVKAAEANGESISCKAGCGACCRQPAPLSEIEVYHIAELVEAIPEPRRTEVKARFDSAARHFQDSGWFDRMRGCAELLGNRPPEVIQDRIHELVTEYFREGIPCPFLENESCSIHEDRPIVCREYLVTTPAENCSKWDRSTITKVGLFGQVSKMIQNFAATGDMDKHGLLPLIRAVELVAKYPSTSPLRTGDEWMSEILTPPTVAKRRLVTRTRKKRRNR